MQCYVRLLVTFTHILLVSARENLYTRVCAWSDLFLQPFISAWTPVYSARFLYKILAKLGIKDVITMFMLFGTLLPCGIYLPVSQKGNA